VFSITITTHERFPWFSRYSELADLLVQTLRATAKERAAGLFAWCVMPDHVHLLLRDPSVVDFVGLVKGRCTPVARLYDPKRRLWQRSFHDHGLRREESLLSVARYILDNPVRGGLVEDAVDYPWSGSEAWPSWREDDWVTTEVEISSVFEDE